MTVVTIKCSKCGKELTSLEWGERTLLDVDPCPRCLGAEYQAGLNADLDDEDWDDEDDDDDWDQDWDEEDDEEDDA